MRVAVLADVHGNLPALRAVLGEVAAERFDVVVSAGDLVSGPWPRECLDALRGLDGDVRHVLGNADRGVIEAWDGAPEAADDPASRQDHFAARRLRCEDRDFLAAGRPTVRVGDVLVCHGTPASDTGRVTPRTPPEELAGVLAGVDAPIVVGGHVHVQFVARSGATTWACAGSVGLPYEGAPGAYWAEVGPAGVVHHHTAYDAEATAAALLDTGLPDAEGVAAAVRGAVTREDALGA